MGTGRCSLIMFGEAPRAGRPGKRRKVSRSPRVLQLWILDSRVGSHESIDPDPGHGYNVTRLTIQVTGTHADASGLHGAGKGADPRPSHGCRAGPSGAPGAAADPRGGAPAGAGAVPGGTPPPP